MKFRHPATGLRVRESLETHEQARAELLRQRVELEAALLDPRFQAVELPSGLTTALGMERKPNVVLEATAPIPAHGELSPQNAPAKRIALNEAIKAYLEFIRSENAVVNALEHLVLLVFY